jgi:CHAT domain-containing protein/Tfp pilus assembly protein PilF
MIDRRAPLRNLITRSTAGGLLFVLWLALLALPASGRAPGIAPGNPWQSTALQEAEKLFNQAVAAKEAGRYKEAITLGERALAIHESQLGPEHRYVAISLFMLALVYTELRDYARAQSYYQRALALFEKLFGVDGKDAAVVAFNLALLYYHKGEYAKAERLFLRALAGYEKNFGTEHPNYLAVLNNLAELYQTAGDYQKAEPIYLRALGLAKKLYGADHTTVNTIQNNLAQLYSVKGDYGRAEPLLQSALLSREKVLGADHPDVAISLNNLAELYRALGDFGRAEPLYIRGLAIAEPRLGKEHPTVTLIQNNMAGMYIEKGDYGKAEPLLQNALLSREKVLGAEHPDMILVLNNLAELYRSKGEYAKAEPLYNRALKIGEKALGTEHPKVLQVLGNLGVLYSEKGDYAKAEAWFRHVLELQEKSLGVEHLNSVTTLNNLAEVYKRKFEPARAEPLLQRALAISEKTLGSEHPLTLTLMNNLAELYANRSDYAKAEPLYLRVLTICEAKFGANHPMIANALSGLANCYQATGKETKAGPLLERALSIREAIFDQSHPMVINSLTHMAELYLSKGDIASAIAFEKRANEGKERELSRTLTLGSEREKIAYLAQSLGQTHFAVSLHLNFAPNQAEAQRLAVTAILQYKGRALDAWADTLAVLHRRASPEDRKLLEQLAGYRAQFAALRLRGLQKETREQYQASLNALARQVDESENLVSQRSLELRTQLTPVTLEEVQKAIPLTAALVEYFVYFPFRAKPVAGEPSFGDARFVAYVLRHQGQPSWVELGDAKTVEGKVNLLRQALRDKTNPDVQRLAREVDALVMQPVRRLLGTTTRVLISPDGALNLVPFAALVDEQNEYLVKRYSFTYLTSGRDLLRLQTRIPGKATKLIIADPDFGEPQVPANQTGDRNEFADMVFEPLKATEGEARDLQQLFPEAIVLTKKQATEVALKNADRPALLHIATHGFFLSDEEELESQGEGDKARLVVRRRKAQVRKPSDDTPMRELLIRSFLAFAGANQRQSGDGNDGILTALEAIGLDLLGTKLVVLSACDTGVGKATNGEGILGLRRALLLAGSQTQVMSLWLVSDQGTREFMLAYYQRLQAGQGRSEALRQVQLEMLANPLRRHPFYWASFIQSGEWANLDGKRVD